MVKVNIISGFLGAGKTTLIKKLLTGSVAKEKIILLENEYGEVGVDGSFMKDSGIIVDELNSGCICCTLVGDFQKAVDDLIAKYHPDRLLIEPSGVGKLSEILAAVERAKERHSDLVVTGCATVVDAGKCRMYMKNFGEFFLDQIKTSATVIFSRTQLLSAERIEKSRALVEEQHPGVRIVTTPWDDLSADTLLEVIESGKPMEIHLDDDDDDDDDEDEHEHHHHHDHDDHDHEDGVCPCCGSHHDDDDDDHDHEHHHHHDHEEHDEDEHEHHHHDHEDGETCSCGHHHHHHGGVDPHIWSSIAGAKAIAWNTLNAFIALDPDNTDYFWQNYNKLSDEIDKTDAEIKKLLDPLTDRTFIIYHPALTYFANEFNLTQLCIEMDGKEPSPAQLKQLVETARANNARVVFIQQEFDQKNAELIAGETGCKLTVINPLAYDWSKEMIHIAKALADGQTH